MTDQRARQTLWITTVVGLVLGIVFSFTTYGTLFDWRAFNVIGLTFILAALVAAGVVALLGYREQRRRDAEPPRA